MGENCLWIQHLLNELAIGRFELLAPLSNFIFLEFGDWLWCHERRSHLPVFLMPLDHQKKSQGSGLTMGGHRL